MVKVKYNDKMIEVLGHANYDKYGKDIVCASVSTLMITMSNLMCKIDEKAINVKENDGYIKVEKIKDNKTIDLIFETIIDSLKELEENYKKYITVKEA